MRAGWAFFLLLLVSAPSRAGEISGVVLDDKGKPVPGVGFKLEIGWARYALTRDFDWWYAVETKTGKTGDDGRFVFADVPEGAVGTVFVKTEEALGIAQGSGALEVKLGPPGAVRGKVLGKRGDIKGLRVYVQGGMGLGGERGTVDKRNGTYEVRGLAPGAGRLFIKRGNWDLARQDMEIQAGKTKKVKSVKITGRYRPSADPMVDCIKAKLVDGEGKAVPGVQLVWSSQQMDGGMSSDEDGIVQLAGGGVAIGRPPYLLRIGSLESKKGMFQGVFREIKRGVAIVELRPLREVTGTVKKREAPVERYRLFVVGPGASTAKRSEATSGSPRVYTARVEDGKFTVHVPVGTCRFVVGTVDGKIHEHEYAVTEAEGPVSHEIQLR